MDFWTAFQNNTVAILMIVIIGVGGWVFTTWLRIKNGYPLEDSWGRKVMPAGPKVDEHTKHKAQTDANTDRIERLEQRVRVLERIATDKGAGLAAEIEGLRNEPLN